ncbi:MAG: succinylglutamate desuccinylase/aspartoacylase family protein, partial [Pseudomonadota bacterium]
ERHRDLVELNDTADNRQPLGFYPVPIASIAGEDGPTLLLIGGVHGDEFEGPVALMRLMHGLDPRQIKGRVLIIPALNSPAVMDSARVSPLDGQNLNRAFPGDKDGGPIAMLADHVERVLMHRCDAVIDIHCGGKASIFAASALATRVPDEDQFARNLGLARAFGAPLIWLLGAFNDNRSVNSAAARQGVPMIAAELGGGGNCDPAMADLAEAGIRRCMAHLGMLERGQETLPEPRLIEITGMPQNLYAPAAGLFDRAFSCGDDVEGGQHAGWIHLIGEPERPPIELKFPAGGVVLAHGNRGNVPRGEMLAMVAQEVDLDKGPAG